MDTSTYVHFVFGLSDEASERRFGFAHYAAVRAAHLHLQPAKLLLHYSDAASGIWWDEACKLVEYDKKSLTWLVEFHEHEFIDGLMHKGAAKPRLHL